MVFKTYIKLLGVVLAINIGLNVYAVLSPEDTANPQLSVQVAICQSHTLQPPSFPSDEAQFIAVASAAMSSNLLKTSAAIYYFASTLAPRELSSKYQQALCYALESIESSAVSARGPPVLPLRLILIF